jgi:hypothetical protein
MYATGATLTLRMLPNVYIKRIHANITSVFTLVEPNEFLEVHALAVKSNSIRKCNIDICFFSKHITLDATFFLILLWLKLKCKCST